MDFLATVGGVAALGAAAHKYELVEIPQLEHAWKVAAVAGVAAVGAALQTAAEFNPLARSMQLLSTFQSIESSTQADVSSSIDAYNSLYDETKTDDERNQAYSSLVDSYYNLVTLFYEWGWGSSFHFAYRMLGESFSESIRRHEYYLMSFLGAGKGDRVLDVGCGIGGPLTNIARFEGPEVDLTGITINQHQVSRGNTRCKQLGLSHRCRLVRGDFTQMPFKDAVFDGAYSIEATCHAPDRRTVFSEVYRTLKPGSYFASYEWVITENHDPNNAKDVDMLHKVMQGDGLPSLNTIEEVKEAMRDVGFEVVMDRDMAKDPEQVVPWYQPLQSTWNPLSFRFQFNWLGRTVMSNLLRVLELFWLAPAGTARVQDMLQLAAQGLVYCGERQTFTVMHILVGRKPLDA
ncbi:uncharacterized protein MONBRDRAFT_33702 [Monosiga brevicollis MX1]|uniref:Methyltransferase n=1 Tax=Monosiga brevicollis TaxID=81824 RepID=A9V6Y8_MONBE|nr:uncharacterized protein MONBRDRAFT_33702 [Monosiga brevicollis MX1]EDQ86698.1 predicted protein [Monosiga brevicollis MX1]|eukprot:XP_001748534.1 hypothetical protein [Monosiga brevicollis MX1]